MNEYELGFDQGERDAFKDRLRGELQRRPPGVPDAFHRGYWDAYEPRSREWRDGAMKEAA